MLYIFQNNVNHYIYIRNKLIILGVSFDKNIFFYIFIYKFS